SEGKIPEVRLDKIKITQVLKNLLANSVESIKNREGEILLILGSENDMIEIQLKDNGTGINGQVFDKLFDEDFSTKSSGTGLGLFIVKRIIDLHKGSITFESSNSGTIVNILLPVNEDIEGSEIG
ncbi:MAG: GHKL domain-containing protein, partial [Candidatus Aminicenantes bacterium]|nr:GHKL domain-containing protein [Candidatus Aminicenantes bacterium]